MANPMANSITPNPMAQTAAQTSGKMMIDGKLVNPKDYLNGSGRMVDSSGQDVNKAWIDGKYVNPTDYLNGSGRTLPSSSLGSGNVQIPPPVPAAPTNPSNADPMSAALVNAGNTASANQPTAAQSGPMPDLLC
jgi:hypothetical protein